ncbi:hypothetical protein CHS0354_031937 [Potamilus streckersoni]|uniref:G-protein coupled receptors family 1 profile domain-containing protein n=1 Tax=Potamilus streckersoni TaxID=2493646 RepID=A0AAE0W2T0_9BIVA|nr:hypothetical protein CHS0354_031937 [Potamilus streckersoni]
MDANEWTTLFPNSSIFGKYFNYLTTEALTRNIIAIGRHCLPSDSLYPGAELQDNDIPVGPLTTFVESIPVITADYGKAISTVNDQMSKTGSVLIGVLLFFFVILTIIGNVLVLLAVFFHAKLRTVSNMFIVSLSIADLLVGIVVMVPATLNEIFREWILLKAFCSVWVAFDVMLCSASILNVCLISLDRYVAIMSPLRYHLLMTHKRALILLSVTYTMCILASFVPVETGLHNPALPNLENLTLISDKPQCVFIPSIPFVAIVSTVTILLPIVVAFVLYYRVSKEAKRQACFAGILIVPSKVLLGKKMSTKHVREPFTRKATITLGIIVGAYVVTWAPFLVTNMTDAVCRCVPVELFKIFVWLGYCNSLINPVIYPLFMRDFRKVYVTFLQKHCPFKKRLKTVNSRKVFFKETGMTMT